MEKLYKDYIHFIDKPATPDSDAKWVRWINASPAISPGFKKLLARTLANARKKDPELGLEVDPILAGQDYPKKGYRVKSIKIVNDHAAVSLEGIGRDSFHISAEMVNLKGQWLLDGVDDLKASTK